MAIKRPRQDRIREVEVEIPGEGTERRRQRGASLDDVLRQIVWDMAARSDWSLSETARRLGVPQPTLQEFFDPAHERGMTLDTLSKVCAALKLSPVDLFRLHERYKPENRDEATFVEDLIFDRFRTVLTPPAARRLVRLIEVWNDRDALASQLDAWERAAGIKKPDGKSDGKGAKPKAI